MIRNMVNQETETQTPEPTEDTEEAPPKDPELDQMVQDMKTELEIPMVAYGFDGKYTTTEEVCTITFCW